MKYCLKIFACLTLPLIVLFVTGCAKPAAWQNMAITKTELSTCLPPGSTLKNNIYVQEVDGGSETHPMWVSRVSNNEFKAAMLQSLKSAELYNPNSHDSLYTLKASLNKLQQPVIGFNFTVTSNVTYRLYKGNSNRLMFEKTLNTPYTARFSETFMGTERLQKANEGSIKENIKEFIHHLYKLKI